MVNLNNGATLGEGKSITFGDATVMSSLGSDKVTVNSNTTAVSNTALLSTLSDYYTKTASNPTIGTWVLSTATPGANLKALDDAMGTWSGGHYIKANYSSSNPKEEDTYLSIGEALTALDTQLYSTSGTADSALQSVVVNGTTLTKNSNAITLDGSNLVLTSYNKGTSSDAVAATDTIDAAFGKVENQIDLKFAKADVKTAKQTSALDTTVYSTGYINDLTSDMATKTWVQSTDGSQTAAFTASTGEGVHNYLTNGAQGNANTLQDALNALGTKVGDTAMTTTSTTLTGAINELNSNKVEKATTVNTKALSGNIVLDGSDINITGYEKAATASALSETDTINVALGKLEKGLEETTSGGITTVKVN